MRTRMTHLCAAVATIALAATGRIDAATVPYVTSANLTYWLDASQSITHGGNGTAITQWRELTTNTAVNIQGTPTYIASGLTGGPAVRFDGAVAAGTKDLIFSNNAPISSRTARTIFVVASMGQDSPTATLSALITNASGVEAIRQTTTEAASYYTGNSGDFHTGAGGAFYINGTAQFAIPGGFNSGHIVESLSPTTVTIVSLRIGDNANGRQWKGDVSEVLVYDEVLSDADRNAVGAYLQNKYGITGAYVVVPTPAALSAGLGLIALSALRRRRRV